MLCRRIRHVGIVRNSLQVEHATLVSFETVATTLRQADRAMRMFLDGWRPYS